MIVSFSRKFVFVAREPRERFLLTIGQALPPMHYALVGTLAERVEGWFQQRRFTLESPTDLLWDGEPIAPPEPLRSSRQASRWRAMTAGRQYRSATRTMRGAFFAAPELWSAAFRSAPPGW